MERVGRVALREAARLGVSRVAFAPLIRDQGNSKFGTGDVEAAVVRGMLLAYDTEKRLQKEGLSKDFTLDQWNVEAGPMYFDETVAGVRKAIEGRQGDQGSQRRPALEGEVASHRGVHDAARRATRRRPMRALRFHKSGELSEARVEEVPRPAPGLGEVLVRVRAAAVNPSDVKNVQGGFSQTTLPRIPGRDFAGVAEAGPSEWLGREVFGTGGGLGFTRDGSHAEYLAVPVEGVVEKPSRLSFEEAAALGVGYLTAWSALVAAGQLRDGETALILGVTGAVGSAGAAIARHLGARVLGTVRREPEASAASCMVDHVIDLSRAGASTRPC